MQRPKIKAGKGPERKIQDAIIQMLESKGWIVKETHGNLYQTGFPDLYCIHEVHKQRWVEVKNPVRYRFTHAQKEYFPILNKIVGVWVLTSPNEYDKLFERPNWWKYLK